MRHSLVEFGFHSLSESLQFGIELHRNRLFKVRSFSIAMFCFGSQTYYLVAKYLGRANGLGKIFVDAISRFGHRGLTGAARSIIRLSEVPKGVKIETTQTKLIGIGGPTRPIGEVEAEVQISSWKGRAKLIVMKDMHWRSIIGRDLMSKAKMKVLTNTKILINGKNNIEVIEAGVR